jgi:hypothetical protein
MSQPQSTAGLSPSGGDSFADHVALLTQFLRSRREIVERIEGTMLNVQGKELSRRPDRAHFDHLLNACFYGLPELPRILLRLKGDLARRHLADGFEPIPIDRFASGLDPLELIGRAHRHWNATRWPGKSGRLTNAGAIYAAFMTRQLEHLSLRLWDAGSDRAADRLRELQVLLDELNAATGTGAFVRDARWLIQTAQGPLTRQLRPYFEIAARVSGSFRDAARVEIHAAGAKLAGGHLRSQLRYALWRSGQTIENPEVLAFTRNSNAMDTALLVGDLVALFDAYERVMDSPERRLPIADAILQGLSADPELLLMRLDLLAPYVFIEDLFLERVEDGGVRYTAMGDARRRVFEQYRERIGRLAAPLETDAAAFDPAGSAYSPYGVVYGFCADILSNMAMDTLAGQSSLGLSLEDMFDCRERLDVKLQRARGWEKLPRREGEREHFEHSIEWAGQMFARLVDALGKRARCDRVVNASDVRSARIFVVEDAASSQPLADSALPSEIASAREHCFTSDMNLAASSGAIAYPKGRLLSDLKEGRFLASCEIDGKWFAISKIVLTALTSQGRDALITGVPRAAIDVLRLTCPELIAMAGRQPAERRG